VLPVAEPVVTVAAVEEALEVAEEELGVASSLHVFAADLTSSP
jgi:hypothetical protein